MSAPHQPEYAFARCDRLKTLAQLGKAQRHADRAPDANCQVRPSTNPNDDQIRWTRGRGDHAFDLIEGWRLAKGVARERKRAPICMHLILGVSPSWVQRAGHLHSRSNPANLALFAAACDFAAREIGTVAAARLDLDEVGGGVVDVFVVPTFQRQRRLRKDGTRSPDAIPEISVNKAFERLRERTGERGDYSALQSAWTRFAQEQLDPTLVRGQRKWMTGRRHLETPEYRALMEGLAKLKKQAEEAKAEIAKLETERAQLDAARRALETREERVAVKEESYRRDIEQQVNRISQAWARRARGLEPTPEDHAAMSSPMAADASRVLAEGLKTAKAQKQSAETVRDYNTREGERLARLRVEADTREQKLVKAEAEARAREADLHEKGISLAARQQRLAREAVELEAAQERAASLAEDARRLMRRAQAAMQAIARRWQGKSEPEDDLLLSDTDFAHLIETADKVREDIERRVKDIEAGESDLLDRWQGIELREKVLTEEQNSARIRETELAQSEADLAQKDAALGDREAKIAAREHEHQNKVAAHADRVAAELGKLERIGPALERFFAGAATAGDQAILNDSLLRGVALRILNTRKMLDAEIVTKKETRDKLAAENSVLEQKSARIRAVGPALAAWLEGKLTQDQKTALQTPEAKPLVDAFNAFWRGLSARRKQVEAQEQELQRKAEEAAKKEADATARLTAMETRASDLAGLIEANGSKANEIEQLLGRYAQLINEFAARYKQPSVVPVINGTIADARSQALSAPKLRRSPIKGGVERD